MVSVEKTITIYEIIAIALGSVSLIWQFLKWLAQRKRISVEAYRGFALFGDGKYDTVNITIKNKRNRPRKINAVGFKTKKRGLILIKLNPRTKRPPWQIELPKTVPAEDSITFLIPLE